jgi:hypothetical protein
MSFAKTRGLDLAADVIERAFGIKQEADSAERRVELASNAGNTSE